MVHACLIVSIWMARCRGVCKSGKQCAITADSTMRDSSGNLVSAPLLAGCSACSFHLETFVAKPLEAPASFVGVLFDTETTGLSVVSDRIVEIGAVDLCNRSAFGVVLNPGRELIELSEGAVHGISKEELERGTTFKNAFAQFDAFLNNSLDMAMSSDDSSDDGSPSAPRLRSDRPTLLLIAHNGCDLNSHSRFKEARVYISSGIRYTI